MFFAQLLNGLTVGAIYGLVGLGFSLIFSVLGLINFAHGHVYMIGAMVAYTVVMLAKLNFFLSVAAAVLITLALGLLIERIAYKPIRKYSEDTQLISSLAVGIVLENVAMVVWGSQTYSFRAETSLNIKYAILVVTVVCVVGMMMFLTKTKTGIAIRATSMNRDMAACLGVDSDRIISFVYGVGSGLAGLAGVLVAAYYATVEYSMGYVMGIKAFIAAIIGGLGNLYGPFAGGLILGVSECLAQAYLNPAYKDAIAYIALVIILLFRPSGLLGKKIEKGG